MTAPAKKKSSSAARVAAYRKRMRDAGLVPRTIWVPDTKDPKFIEEYRRQARAIAADEREKEELEWWFAASDWPRGDNDVPDHVAPDKK